MLKKFLLLFNTFLIFNNLNAQEIITAVIPKNFPPYYTLNENNKPDGFAIELLNAVAKEVNIEVKYTIKDNFNEVNEDFLNAKADVIPNSGIDKERLENSIFTDTTDTFRIVAFKRYSKEIDNIEDKKVIVVEGNIGQNLMKNHPNELLIVKKSNKDALFSLLSGEADVLVYPEIPIINILKTINLNDKVISFGKPLKEVKRAIRVRKDKPELLEKLNLGLKKIKQSGEYEKIYSKWFGTHDIVEVKKSYLNTIYTSGIITISLFIITILFLIRTLQLKKSLVLSNNKFKNMFNNHDSIMMLINPNNGDIIDANKSAIKFYGYSKEELLSMNINEINLLSKEEIKKRREEAFNNKINRFEFSHKLKDGTVKIVEVSSTPIENENKKILFSIIEDITEKKANENLIKQQHLDLLTLKNTLDKAIEAASLGIWEWNARNNITIWSDISYDIYGIDKNLSINFKSIENLIVPEDLELYKENVEKALREKESFNFEYRIKKEDEIKTIVTIGKPIIENDQLIKITGIVQDITEFRKKEKELLTAQKIPKLGHYDYDIINDSFTTSIILDKTFGISKDYVKTFQSWMNLIHEDDKEMMKDYFFEIVSKKENFNKEYRIRDFKTGAIKWIHGLGVIKYNKDGSAYRMYGTIQDITQRKTYENQMKQALTVFENTNEGIMITNSNNEIINVNNSFILTTGYSIDEVIGKKPSILKSNIYPMNFYEEMWNNLNTKGYWQGEITNKRKNGELYEEYLTINVVKNSMGKIDSYIGIFSDISIIKHQEKMILQQARTSAIGEMIGNIAHQWRQPLSVISTAATGMKIQLEMMGELSKEQTIDILNKINEHSQYLSKTIEDFRGFFTEDLSQIKEFKIIDVFEKVKNLTKDAFTANFVELFYDIDEEIHIEGNSSLFIQALINIYNNALDVLKTKDSKDKKLLFIKAEKVNTKINIYIKDNGGGIPEEFIEKIFDPYFTTKHQSQGTGIGLYMTHQIITKQLKGNIIATNVSYTHEGKQYEGAEFFISI